MVASETIYRWIVAFLLQALSSQQIFSDQAFIEMSRKLTVPPVDPAGCLAAGYSRVAFPGSSVDPAGCLAAGNSRLAFPGSADYNSASIVYQRRYAYSPAAFVFPTTVGQVQNAVTCAVQLKIGISPLSGGHSYEDYSLGGRNGVLVVDLAGLNDVKYNKESNTATVGAGVRLGPLKLALWNLGKVTVPAGDSPSIGVGGHALGGGWGFTSRNFGLLSDNILEMEVVTSNGTVVIANAIKNSDLFWAMRGAGANSFGIVTEFTFRVHDVSAPVTSFSFSYKKTEQQQTIKAFQKWGLSAGKESTACLYVDPSGGNNFIGTYLGPSSSLNGALSTFFANAPSPSSQTVLQTDFIHSVLINAGFAADADPSVLNLDQNFTYPTALFKAKSIFVKNPGFSNAGIQTFVETVQAGQPTSYMNLDLFGGSESIVNSIAAGESAWVHRDSLFSIHMVSDWQLNPSQASQDLAFIDTLWTATLPFASSEACQNYIDRDMPLSAYYGANLDRLISIKRTWDQTNVFNFPQSIPLHCQQQKDSMLVDVKR